MHYVSPIFLKPNPGDTPVQRIAMDEQIRTIHKKKFEEWLNAKASTRNSTIMSKAVYDQTVQYLKAKNVGDKRKQMTVNLRSCNLRNLLNLRSCAILNIFRNIYLTKKIFGLVIVIVTYSGFKT